MTVIIGMRGYPGVVLGADTEETISGYSKRTVDKVGEWKSECLCFAIGGAGAGHHADALADKIAAELLQVRAAEPSAEMLTPIIERLILEFHQAHIFPRASVSSTEDAAVQLIIVVQPLLGGYAEHGHIWVWQTCDSAVLHITGERTFRSYASVGIGSHLADYLLGRLFVPAGGEGHLVLMAAYVLREVGATIAQVGKEPHISLFRTNGTMEWFGFHELQKFEGVFKEYDHLIKDISHFAIDPGPDTRCTLPDKRMQEYTLEVRDAIEREWQNYLTLKKRINNLLKQPASQKSVVQQ